MKSTRKAPWVIIGCLLVAVITVFGILFATSDDPLHPGGLGIAATTTSAPVASTGPARLVVGDTIYPVVLELVAAFKADNNGAAFIVQHAPDLQARALATNDARTNLFIADAKVVGSMPRRTKPPVLLGTDPLVIAVPRGNPGLVVDLSAFGPDSPQRSGLCRQPEPCAVAADAELRKAGVTPAPDVVASADELLAVLSGGGLDAALLYRSVARQLPVRVVIVGDETADAKTDIRFATVALAPNVTAQQFMDFTQISPAAERILRRYGLAQFEAEAPDDGRP